MIIWDEFESVFWAIIASGLIIGLIIEPISFAIYDWALDPLIGATYAKYKEKKKKKKVQDTVQKEAVIPEKTRDNVNEKTI